VNIVLMGLRGSGKSTLGRLLAERLKLPLCDLDELTARAMGAASVGEAWMRHGEAAFRKAEVRALSEALERADASVVALGGGTPTAPGAADLIAAQQKQGRVLLVYLSAEPENLRARLASDDNTNRPSLTGADPLLEMEAVHAKRDPLYRRMADEVIDTDELSIEETVEALAALAL
jgi:shikimate kinase